MALQLDSQHHFRLKVEQLEHHHAVLVQCLPCEIAKNSPYLDPVTGFDCYRQWVRDYADYQSADYLLAVIKVGNLRSLNIRKSNAMGDWLLHSVARQLQQHLDPRTHFYRFRGARFMLMAPVAVGSQAQWAQQLLSILQSSQQLPDGEQAKIYWQIGITPMRAQASALELIDECDLALKQLAEESSWSIYHVNYRSGLLQYCQQQDRVLNALNEQHLELYLQPQTLANGVIVGYECLARLFDENGTLLLPDQFMAYIEEQNRYAELAKLVFRQATEMLQHWPPQAPCVPLSINLAGPELLDDDFFSGLKSRYQQSELLRRRLAIELTETSIFSHHQQTQQRLNELSQLGVALSIDDFGTGHASLAQLVDISVVALKIDQLFVSRVIDSEKHASIIRASIELARSLGLKVVAEGVETEEQLNALTALGCQIFQGFFFGRPTPLNQLQASYSSL